MKGQGGQTVASPTPEREGLTATHALRRNSPQGSVCFLLEWEKDGEVDTRGGGRCLGGLALRGSPTLVLTLRPAHKLFILLLPKFLENFFVNNFPALVVNVTRSLRKEKEKGGGKALDKLSPLRTPLN